VQKWFAGDDPYYVKIWPKFTGLRLEDNLVKIIIGVIFTVDRGYPVYSALVWGEPLNLEPHKTAF